MREGIRSGGKWKDREPPFRRVSDTHYVRESDVELPPLEEVLNEG
jgi:hypothetical protein